MIFARKGIKMNNYRKQSPEIETTISHNDKNAVVHLYHSEKIKWIPEFPNYHFTSEGDVWSWKKHGFLNRIAHPEKPNKDGRVKYYVKYELVDKNGESHQMYAQRLVWMVFGGTLLDENKEIHHIDGDSLNNQIGNLMQVTKEEHDEQFESPYLIIQVDNLDLRKERSPYEAAEFYGAYSKEDAADFLGMTEKELKNLLKKLDRTGTGNPKVYAPDGRLVIKPERIFPPFSVLGKHREP